MNILTRKDSNLCLWAFENSEIINIKTDCVEIGDPIKLRIFDCDSNNVNIFSVNAIPEDWIGCKYIYTEENGFELSPDWIDPDAPVSEDLVVEDTPE